MSPGDIWRYKNAYIIIAAEPQIYSGWTDEMLASERAMSNDVNPRFHVQKIPLRNNCGGGGETEAKKKWCSKRSKTARLRQEELRSWGVIQQVSKLEHRLFIVVLFSIQNE